jgi:hypothetical protein
VYGSTGRRTHVSCVAVQATKATRPTAASASTTSAPARPTSARSRPKTTPACNATAKLTMTSTRAPTAGEFAG